MKSPDPKHTAVWVYWGQGTLNAAWLLAAFRRRGAPVEVPALSAGAAPPIAFSLPAVVHGLPTLLPTSADDPCRAYQERQRWMIRTYATYRSICPSCPGPISCHTCLCCLLFARKPFVTAACRACVDVAGRANHRPNRTNHHVSNS